MWPEGRVHKFAILSIYPNFALSIKKQKRSCSTPKKKSSHTVVQAVSMLTWFGWAFCLVLCCLLGFFYCADEHSFNIHGLL